MDNRKNENIGIPSPQNKNNATKMFDLQKNCMNVFGKN